MKKLVWFLSILTCCLIVSVAHADGSCGANLTWTLQDGTLTISGTGDMGDWVDYSPWYIYAPWFMESAQIKTVIIQEGCSSITESSFVGCYNLQSVTIPEGVTAIGDSAFANCYALTEITLPATLKTIGEAVFDSCSKLDCFNVAKSNPNFVSIDGVLFTADRSSLLYYPSGKQDVTYDIPQGVTTIGAYAFYGNKTLRQVTFPDGLTTIGKSAFRSVDLVTLSFPETLTSIGSNAFGSNDVLTAVTIPASVLTLDYGAFSWCGNLFSVTVEGMYTSFDSWGVFDFCNDNLVIYGLEKSTAQLHATTEDIEFCVIDAQSSNNLADTWTCPTCGTSVCGYKFCYECGTVRPEDPKSCGSCGFTIPDDMTMKFCPECGAKLE